MRARRWRWTSYARGASPRLAPPRTGTNVAVQAAKIRRKKTRTALAAGAARKEGGSGARQRRLRRRACARGASIAAAGRRTRKRGAKPHSEPTRACGRGAHRHGKTSRKRVYFVVLISLFSIWSIAETFPEAGGVGGPEEAGPGLIRDALKERLVDVHLCVNALLGDSAGDGVLRLDRDLHLGVSRADPDRVDLDAQRLCDSGRRVGVDLAGVVPAVGHEDHDLDFAAGLPAGQARSRERGRWPCRRPGLPASGPRAIQERSPAVRASGLARRSATGRRTQRPNRSLGRSSMKD